MPPSPLPFLIGLWTVGRNWFHSSRGILVFITVTTRPLHVRSRFHPGHCPRVLGTPIDTLSLANIGMTGPMAGVLRYIHLSTSCHEITQAKRLLSRAPRSPNLITNPEKVTCRVVSLSKYELHSYRIVCFTLIFEKNFWRKFSEVLWVLSERRISHGDSDKVYLYFGELLKNLAFILSSI